MSAMWRVDSVRRLSSAPSTRCQTRLSPFTSPFHGLRLKTPASYCVPRSRRRPAYLLCLKSPLSAVGFDGVSIPLTFSAVRVLGASIPYLIPLGVPAPLAAFAASFLRRLDSNCEGPAGRRLIGSETKRTGRPDKKRGLSAPSSRVRLISAGLRSAKQSPPRSVVHPPGRQGISRGPCGSRPRSGSCMRRSTARTPTPPCCSAARW
jgi:hypothetical protein